MHRVCHYRTLVQKKLFPVQKAPLHRKNFFSQRRRLNSSKKYFLTGAAKNRRNKVIKYFPSGGIHIEIHLHRERDTERCPFLVGKSGWGKERKNIGKI